MNYIKYETSDKKEIFIDEDFIDILKILDSLIFDCDGVLVNTANSFDQAVKNTVDYLFTNILQLQKPKQPFVTNEDIIILRNTGGLGNDWDLSFMIILYYFCSILLKFENLLESKNLIFQALKKIQSNLDTLQNRIDGFKILRNLFKKLKVPSNDLILSKEKGIYTLSKLASQIDSSGVNSGKSTLLTWLNPTYPNIGEMWASIENLFGYELPHLRNLTKRIFEEIYLGSEMFRNIYNSDPIFYFGPGQIENEFLIPVNELFQELISDYGFKKFGIASSRPRDIALQILEKHHLISNYFNKDALVFLNDIYREERIIFKDTGKKIKLEKPNPYSLISSAQQIKPKSGDIGYVGDTASDFQAVRNADEDSEFNFYSICIYGSSNEPEKLQSKFIELGANVIIPSPNNIVDLCKIIGREKI